MTPRNLEDIFFDQYEQKQFEDAQDWFAAALSHSGSDSAPEIAPPPADEKLIILCMTPRSGSTALSMALHASQKLGKGGERLNRKEGGPLDNLAKKYRPRRKVDLLSAAINNSASANDVRLIKCALPQISPFLMNRACADRLRHARFVLLTRNDVLGQAISLFRGHRSGVWHSVQKGADTIGEIEYDFKFLHQQIRILGNMLSSYEKIFASQGIDPLRITYEDVVSDTAAVAREIAALVDVDLSADVDLSSSGHKKLASIESDKMRAQFIADFHAALEDDG